MDRKSPGPFTITRNVFWGLLAVCCVIIVIGATVPLSQPRIPMNHRRAANSSVQLIAAERQYATRFQRLASHVIFANLLRQALSIQCWLPVKGRLSLRTTWV